MAEYTVREDFIQVHDAAVENGWAVAPSHRGSLHLTHRHHFGRIEIPLEGTVEARMSPEVVAKKLGLAHELGQAIAAEGRQVKKADSVPGEAQAHLLTVEACYASSHRVVQGVVQPKQLNSFERGWSDGTSDRLCAVAGCGESFPSARAVGTHFGHRHTGNEPRITERDVLPVLDASGTPDVPVEEAAHEAAEAPTVIDAAVVESIGDRPYMSLRREWSDGSVDHICAAEGCRRVAEQSRGFGVHFAHIHKNDTDLVRRTVQDLLNGRTDDIAAAVADAPRKVLTATGFQDRPAAAPAAPAVSAVPEAPEAPAPSAERSVEAPVTAEGRLAVVREMLFPSDGLAAEIAKLHQELAKKDLVIAELNRTVASLSGIAAG